MRPRAQNPFEIYFGRRPPWLKGKNVSLREQVAEFLRDINGKVPISKLAEVAGYNRYSTARWLSGDVEPRLPEFLALVHAATSRLADFIATLVEPDRLPSLAKAWSRLQLARVAADERSWSHAVLRALELVSLPRGKTRQTVWLAQTLGLSVPEVKACLELLEATGQVRRLRGSYRLGEPVTIETGRDTVRGRTLKMSWTKTALGRLESGSKDHFGYSLFAVSRADFVKIRELHLDYVRAMQRLIAQSESPECVGLYCSQLLDLSSQAVSA